MQFYVAQDVLLAVVRYPTLLRGAFCFPNIQQQWHGVINDEINAHGIPLFRHPVEFRWLQLQPKWINAIWIAMRRGKVKKAGLLWRLAAPDLMLMLKNSFFPMLQSFLAHHELIGSGSEYVVISLKEAKLIQFQGGFLKYSN